MSHFDVEDVLLRMRYWRRDFALQGTTLPTELNKRTRHKLSGDLRGRGWGPDRPWRLPRNRLTEGGLELRYGCIHKGSADSNGGQIVLELGRWFDSE